MSAMPDMPPEMMDPGVDPNSPPADPMLAGPFEQQPPEQPDPYGGVGEHEYREQVEICLLGALERCAKGVEVGVGAENPQFAQAYAQSAASLGQAYAALVGAEVQM